VILLNFAPSSSSGDVPAGNLACKFVVGIGVRRKLYHDVGGIRKQFSDLALVLFAVIEAISVERRLDGI
jgi:hypothetical protein